MKKNPFSYSRMVAAILIITAITGSVIWFTPSLAQTKKGKTAETNTAPAKQGQQEASKTNDYGENELVQQLINDRLVDEIKGFTVEKKDNILYIDGQPQSTAISNKYLSQIKQEVIKVEVYPFSERLKRHPDAGIMQLIAPVSFSSPCVAYTPKKPGC